MTASEHQSAEYMGRQLLKNSVLMVLARCAGVLSLIVAVPVIVASLGPEGYGVWESLLAISGIALVFQLVISGTVLWRISMSFGSQDPGETRRLIRISVGATLSLMLVFVPIVWIYRDALLFGLQIAGHWAVDSRWLLPSMVGVMLLGGVNQALLAVLTGYQRAGLAALIQSAGLMVTHLTAIGLLLCGFGMQSLLFGFLAGFTAMFVVLYPLASSLCGRISLLPLLPSWKDLAVLGPFAGLLLISNLSFIFRDHTDKVVLASFDSPITTGYFGMAQRLAALVMQASVVVGAPLTAAIGALYARGDWDGIRKMYEKIGSWMAAFAGLAGLLVCTLRKPLFVVWLGRDYPQAHGFLVLLLLGVTSAIVFAGAGVAVARGIGRPGLETAYTLVTLALTVLSKPILIALFGPIGSVASSAACWFLGAVFLLFLLHRKIALPSQMISRFIGIYVVTVLASAIGWCAADFYTFPAGRLPAAVVLVGLGAALGFGYLAVLAGLRLIPVSVSLKESCRTLMNNLAWRRA